MLADAEIDVIDVTLHPEHRAPIIEAALKAGKHVLSQKPFVTDLGVGEDLVKLAEDKGVKLAVNQNGRWAPHKAWMREAVRAGLIGDVISAHVSLHWNHGWTAGTPFDEIEDLVLYDFGVHWFDFIASLTGRRAQSVFASASHASGQANKVPLLAQALVRLDGGQASLVFDGGAPHGPRDTTYVAGTAGSLQADGPDLGAQTVTLTTARGSRGPLWKANGSTTGSAARWGASVRHRGGARAVERSAREPLQPRTRLRGGAQPDHGQGGRGRRGPAAGKLRGRKTRFSVREICRFPTRKTAVLLPVCAGNAALRSSR
jgi:predicted dehydrogenase